MNFYYPEKIEIPNSEKYPIFQFGDELRELNPECKWTIIGKPAAMVDVHVAEIYEKSTKAFNQQVQRNIDYFKAGWRFQPTCQEWNILKTLLKKELRKAVTSSDRLTQLLDKWALSATPPWFYTKEGVDMAAFFQKTPVAKQYAIYIVESFNKFQLQNQRVESDSISSVQEQLKDVYYMIKAIVDQINLLNERCRKFEEQNAHRRTVAMGVPVAASEVFSPPEEAAPVISPEQAQKLKLKVAAISPERKKRMKIWAEFKREFNLTRYIHLPAHQFEEAMYWLQNFGL